MSNQTHSSPFFSFGQNLPVSIDSGVLETFIPAFGIFRRLVQVYFGFDVTNLVTACFLVTLVLGALRYCFSFIWDWLESIVTCSVAITARTDLFDEVETWMSEQKFMQSARHLLAEDSSLKDLVWLQTETGNQGYDAITPPEYQIAYGESRFWHKGNLIYVEHTEHDWSKSKPEMITLSCYGFSSKPLKDLIIDCKRFGADYSRANTKIHVASDDAGDTYWDVGNTRPSRSVDTVYMRQSVKDDLLDDLREYLDPLASKFYARRGIPYRRGYLFVSATLVKC